MATKECDDCGEETERKYLGKIRGKYLCRKCRKKVREKHREETINKEGIKKELKSLDRKINKTYRDNKNKIKEAPIPKGSVSGKIKQKNKSESYLSFIERQILLKILMRRGLDFKEAKEKITNIKNQLRETRKLMKNKNKSESQIKIKKQKMLEELWNY